MRNYLRETIRDEVREGARHDSAAAAAGNQPSGDQVGDDRAGRPVQGESETQAQFRVVLRPLASSLPLEERYQRAVLPLGRRGRARSSIEGSFAHQVQQAEQEPGVRRQL